MKRPDVVPTKDASIRRKQALIRQLIEQATLTASTPPSPRPSGDRPLAEIIPFPREFSRSRD